MPPPVLSHDGTVPASADQPPTEPIPVGRLPLEELRLVDLGDSGRPVSEAVAAFRSEPGQRMATLGGALALLVLFGATGVRLDVWRSRARGTVTPTGTLGTSSTAC